MRKAPEMGVDAHEMIASYEAATGKGLRNVRLGNIGVFARSEQDLELLRRSVDL